MSMERIDIVEAINAAFEELARYRAFYSRVSAVASAWANDPDAHSSESMDEVMDAVIAMEIAYGPGTERE
jgi:hypothetical protein